MPRFTFNIEIDLAKMLVDRSTAHLAEPSHEEKEAVLRFIYNAMHQNLSKAQTAVYKMAIAIKKDQYNRARPEQGQTDLTEEVMHEALVAFGVWDYGKVLSPAFEMKIALAKHGC